MGAGVQTPRRHAVVFEDNRDLSDMIGQALRGVGYEVLPAYNLLAFLGHVAALGDELRDAETAGGPGSTPATWLGDVVIFLGGEAPITGADENAQPDLWADPVVKEARDRRSRVIASVVAARAALRELGVRVGFIASSGFQEPFGAATIANDAERQRGLVVYSHVKPFGVVEFLQAAELTSSGVGPAAGTTWPGQQPQQP